MKYSMDLKGITIPEYKELLTKQTLLPGRRILLDQLDGHFIAIMNTGISNVYALKNALSTPLKIVAFSKQTHITEAYLVVLKREIGSLDQKPVQIKDFPEIDEAICHELMTIGIKTSKDYYESDYHNNQQKTSSIELYSLCDLVRINGVGATAAKAFFDAGYISVLDVANAEAEEMLNKVSQVNEIKRLYQARLGVKDMQFCIDFAKLLVRYQG